jgi:hypothetical protein
MLSQESQVSSFVLWRLQDLWASSYLRAEHYRTDSEEKAGHVDRYGFTPHARPMSFLDPTVLNL